MNGTLRTPSTLLKLMSTLTSVSLSITLMIGTCQQRKSDNKTENLLRTSLANGAFQTLLRLMWAHKTSITH